MDDPARFSAALPPQSRHTGLPDLRALTVVMPVLNAEQTLPGTLAALEGVRVIAANGGSRDATVAVATAAGAVVVTAAAGRGVQLAAGAAAATTEWLLFLHGDTCLGPGWRDEVACSWPIRGLARPQRSFVFASMQRDFGQRCLPSALPRGAAFGGFPTATRVC